MATQNDRFEIRHTTNRSCGREYTGWFAFDRIAGVLGHFTPFQTREAAEAFAKAQA